MNGKEITMRAFNTFNKGVLMMPRDWQLWHMLLVADDMIGKQVAHWPGMTSSMRPCGFSP